MISEDRHKYLTDLGCMAVARAAARAYVPPPAPPSPTNRGNCGRCAGQGTIAAFYCFACNGRGSR